MYTISIDLNHSISSEKYTESILGKHQLRTKPVNILEERRKQG